jgi:exodeoxyribonuclease VII large subunit
MPGAFDRLHREAAGRLARASDLLNSLSYERTLERGFAIVQDSSGAPVTSVHAARPGSDVSIRFHDGAVGATVHGESAPRARPPAPRRKPKASSDDPQGSLI